MFHVRQHPVDILDAIGTEADEATALLQMLRVFCNLEQRDMTAGCVDGTLSDAAEGLEIVMRNLADRVESMKQKATKLYEHGLPHDAPERVQ